MPTSAGTRAPGRHRPDLRNKPGWWPRTASSALRQLPAGRCSTAALHPGKTDKGPFPAGEGHVATNSNVGQPQHAVHGPSPECAAFTVTYCRRLVDLNREPSDWITGHPDGDLRHRISHGLPIITIITSSIARPSGGSVVRHQET